MGVVLVLRTLGLGDFLTAIPALRGLRSAYPAERLVLAAPPALGPLAQLSATIDDLDPVETLAPLRQTQPDVAVNLHGRGPQSHRLLEATRPGRLVAYRNPEVPASAAGPAWREDEHERFRWCRLLEESGMPADPNDLDLPAPSSPTAGDARGMILIHPGGSSVARRWPVADWAQVAGALAADGHEVGVTAGPGEEALAAAVGQPVWSGRRLVDLAALVAGSRLVLSGDTGIAHLATALRRPSVVLFGPTSPAVWGPPPERPWHRVLWKGRVGDPWGEENHPTLLEIRPAEVLSAARQLLDTTDPLRATGFIR